MESCDEGATRLRILQWRLGYSAQIGPGSQQLTMEPASGIEPLTC